MATDTTREEDQFYIVAGSPRADDRTRVLKHGETFVVFDRSGDIRSSGLGEEGLYHEGTRHLRDLHLRLWGHPPLLLGSTISDDNSLLIVDLTNPDVSRAGNVVLPRETLHVLRSAFVHDGTCHVRLQLHNYSRQPVDAELHVSYGADFVDLFEVRGMHRARRGTMLAPERSGDGIAFAYRGLDDVLRRTVLRFDPAPAAVDERGASLRLRVEPGAQREQTIGIRCEVAVAAAAAPADAVPFDAAYGRFTAELGHGRQGTARVTTSNRQFDEWLERSTADLRMMITATDEGPYPYAGVPWYSTVFGRDGLVTALQYLWIDPGLARGVLLHLAATQAEQLDEPRDAQPGRILHEARRGEMAALREVPFGRYYGSADSTPLFVLLAGEYLRVTDDLDTARRLWPHVQRALDWIDEWADPDGDGFYEYARQSPDGLVSQGWKDSFDSVFHADGTLARAPIALCEMQGYVYAAWLAAAQLALALGDDATASRLVLAAEELQRRFDDAYWCEDLSTYALALDADKRPCRVRASNAGHCLFAGIARPDRALRVGQQLVSPEFFTGFGVRTVAVGEARYNPMSYHNGSVWPHDNALLALGTARYGMREPALRILQGLFEASTSFDLQRLPELFCGFPRRRADGPTQYPLACAPQAWAAGAPFMLLQACLGMSADASARELRFRRPQLPPFLDTVRIEALRVGDARVDIELTRYENDVGVNLRSRDGALDVVVAK